MKCKLVSLIPDQAILRVFHPYVCPIGEEIVAVIGGVLSTVIEVNFSAIFTSEILETISFICLTSSETTPENQTIKL